jgi:ATP phosphoribosyltransferase regulatory subunit
MATWALPESLEDILPAEAARLEAMRRIAIDTFTSRGYGLVVPPLIEYVDSLLSGVGKDMDLATFKLVDQLSGRMLGVRADTTPQVARIDAHVLNKSGVVRLCYAGSVLHTRPAGLGKSRQPFQVGAELYGYAGLLADIEIQELTLDVLVALGIPTATLDIGHPGIFRAIADSANLHGVAREEAFAAVSAKDRTALDALARRHPAAGSLAALPDLFGANATMVIAAARAALPTLPAVSAALDALAQVAEHFEARGGSLPVAIDLGELGGYNYESGITFSVYADGAADAIARGGRYDDIGHAFGRARPATGFSMDLKALLSLAQARLGAPAESMHLVVASAHAVAARAAITEYRDAGQTVTVLLPGESTDVEGATHQLIPVGEAWQAVALAAAAPAT